MNSVGALDSVIRINFTWMQLLKDGNSYYVNDLDRSKGPVNVNVSVNSKPDHPPRSTPGDSHILVAPGVGFSLLCLARGALKSK